MQKHTLSKTTYMYGCQCLKRLFLHKYRPDLKNPRDEQQQAVFDAGTNIGLLAQQLFPGGVDASPPDTYSYDIAVAKTQELINDGHTTIYEACFQYEGVLCALDILVKKGNLWYAYEVKSTTSAKPQHVQDAALQYYVVTNCGLTLGDFSIVHLNNQYVRMGDIDVHQLFITTSVLEDLLEEQEYVNNKLAELKEMLAQQTEPIIDIGSHCYSPYECDFTNHCFSHVPPIDSVFDLPGKVAWKLYNEGYRNLLDIPEDIELKNKAAMQLAHYRSGEVHIDQEALQEFLAPLTYPLYFFDFETYGPGIPEFDNSRPYQQIPFQYSLHVQRHPNAELQHHAFLGDGVNDPREELMNAMIDHLGDTGSIICYNMTFEKTRIKELARIYPDFEQILTSINERVIDLMVPFARRWYYHPNFKSRYSIKTVLPVLVPDLRYDQLEIGDGSMASLVYGQLKLQDEETAAMQREQLLEYCKLDTVAMVRILEYLQRQ